MGRGGEGGEEEGMGRGMGGGGNEEGMGRGVGMGRGRDVSMNSMSYKTSLTYNLKQECWAHLPTCEYCNSSLLFQQEFSRITKVSLVEWTTGRKSCD